MAEIRRRARIDVMLKPGIADPQGQTVERALPALGWENAGSVRIGKHLELVVTGPDEESVQAQVRDMCDTFLTNPVIESYAFVLEPA